MNMSTTSISNCPCRFCDPENTDKRVGAYRKYEVGMTCQVMKISPERGKAEERMEDGILSEITEKGEMILKDGRKFGRAGDLLGGEDHVRIYMLIPDIYDRRPCKFYPHS